MPLGGSRRTIRGRLLAGFGTTIALLFGAGVVGITLLTRGQDELRRHTADVMQVKAGLATNDEATQQYVVRAQQDLLRQRETSSARLDSLEAVADSVRRWLTTETTLGDVDRAHLARIGTLQSRIGARLSIARAWQDIGRTDQATAESELAAYLLDSLFVESRALASSEDARSSAIMKSAESRAHRQQQIVTALLALGLLVAATFGYLTWRAVTAPLGRMAEVARRVGEGDLTGQLDTTDLDEEYRVLAEALAEATRHLSSLVGAIQQEAQHMDGAAASLTSAAGATAAATGELSSVMTQIANAAASQLDAVGNSAEVLETAAATAESLDSAAAQSRIIEADIDRLSNEAHSAVSGAVAALASARDVIGTSQKNVERVESASEVVSEFVETIERIARQTNLLALNAAIEAARAGESGRGFAVVAEEVRKLADESRRSAQEVRSVVSAIRSEVATASSSFRSGVAALGDVDLTAQKATQALDAIRQMDASIDALTQAVITAAEANRRSIDSLHREIRSVSDQAQSQASASEEASASAEETAATSEEVAATAHELASSAGRLGALVTSFRV